MPAPGTPVRPQAPARNGCRHAATRFLCFPNSFVVLLYIVCISFDIDKWNTKQIQMKYKWNVKKIIEIQGFAMRTYYCLHERVAERQNGCFRGLFCAETGGKWPLSDSSSQEEDRLKAMWRHSLATNKSSLTYLLIGTWVRDNYIRKREGNHKKFRIIVTEKQNNRWNFYKLPRRGRLSITPHVVRGYWE